MLGEAGFAEREDRRAGHRDQSPDPSRDAEPAGRSGAGRAFRRDPRDGQAAVQRAPYRDHRPVQAGRPVQALQDRRSAARADRHDASSPMPRSRSCRSTAAAPSTSRCGSSRRRRTPSPASLATAPGRARGSKRAGPIATSSIPEGALTLRGVAGTSEQLLGVQFRRSNFLRRDQVLNLQVSASHQKFDAYEAQDRSARRQYRAAEQFHLAEEVDLDLRRRAAGDRRARRVRPDRRQDTRTFLIAAAPSSLGYDGSDSLLDPTRGFRLSGRVSPEISAHGGQFTYARTQFDASAYHPVGDHVVAAGRVRLGTIIGAGRLRHRAVAALLFGRRRVGARLRLSAARAQGRRRRPDRRPRPRRVRARSAHPPDAVRRQFRGRAVLRRRIADHRSAARLQGLAFRGRARRALLFELRADPHRRRRAA